MSTVKDYHEEKSDFFLQVFEVVKLIPFGKVTSYGAIAKYLGAAKSSRMVGYAMNASHKQPENIPAHRVVNRNGLLTGKMNFETPTFMEECLATEAVVVVDNQIQDFSSHFWDPALNLDL